MTDVLATPLAQALGLGLVHFIWQGAAIGLAVWLLLALAGNAAAGTRYLIACAGLVLLTAAPVVTTMQAADVLVNKPDSAFWLPMFRGGTQVAAVTGMDEAAGTAPGLFSSSLTSWLPAVVLVWSLGVVLLTIRLARGWFDVRRIRRHAGRPLSTPLRDAMARIGEQLGVTRAVHLAESSMVDVPTVIGWLRPTILMPVSALSGLSPSQIEAIVAHELAHVRRHDYLINSLQNVVETMLFYHPAVWWVSRQMRVEREHCCDDLALSLYGNRAVYAGALASLEESRQRTLGFGVAATGGDLLSRVRRILRAPSPRPQGMSFSLAACVALAIVSLPFIAGAAAPQGGRLEPASDGLPRQLNQYGALLGGYSDQVNPNAEQQANAQVLVADLNYRRAIVRRDVAALDTMISDSFYEARQDQGVLSKSQVLGRAGVSRVTTIDVDSINVRLVDDMAVIVGSQIERTGPASERMLFTRVWSRGTGNNWTLISSSQFRDTSPAGSSGPIAGADAGAAPGVQESIHVTGGQGQVPPPPPPPPPTAGTVGNAASGRAPIPVGGEIRAPMKVKDVKPAYPIEARFANVQGIVIMEATIDETGAVTDVQVLRSVPMLDAAAVQAVRQWRYTPTMMNGVPVSVMMTVTVNFTLN